MNTNIGIVKVYKSKLVLNDDIITDQQQLPALITKFQQLEVEAHERVSPARVIEVMNILRTTWRGAINFKAVTS